MQLPNSQPAPPWLFFPAVESMQTVGSRLCLFMALDWRKPTEGAAFQMAEDIGACAIGTEYNGEPA